jgi:hypothetical protein
MLLLSLLLVMVEDFGISFILLLTEQVSVLGKLYDLSGTLCLNILCELLFLA